MLDPDPIVYIEKGRVMQSAVIDDLSREPPVASIGISWQLFTDRGVGGVSHGVVIRDPVKGRPAIRLRGIVILENNGGFIQLGRDPKPNHGTFDASAYRSVQIDEIGNEQDYNVHLRTDYLTQPWQSCRQSFKADTEWRTIVLHFENFLPHRTDIPLDTRHLR